MTPCCLRLQSALALALLVLISVTWLSKAPARADFALQDVNRPLATAFLIPLIYGGSDRAERFTADEARCLALNIYWEARSESLRGQLAVGAVTLNRVADPHFPGDICGVVYQGGEARRHRCQFSWWCDGKKDDPLEAEAWARAQQVARRLIAGSADDPTDGALWYHADYVRPAWRASMAHTVQIGRHVFYRRDA